MPSSFSRQGFTAMHLACDEECGLSHKDEMEWQSGGHRAWKRSMALRGAKRQEDYQAQAEDAAGGVADGLMAARDRQIIGVGQPRRLQAPFQQV